MKKFIFCMLLCLCILFVSCDTSDATSSQNTEPQPTDSVPKETELFFPFILDGSGNIIKTKKISDDSNSYLISDIHEHNPIHISSYDIYQEFVKLVNLPEHFIFYDNISVLGEFDIFHNYYRKSPEIYEAYDYDLTNGEVVISLSISHTGSLGNLNDMTGVEKISEEDVNPYDIRYIDKEARSYYHYKGINFRYSVGGKLSFLAWESNGVHYYLSCENFFMETEEMEDYSFLNNFKTYEAAFKVISSFAPPDIDVEE